MTVDRFNRHWLIAAVLVLTSYAVSAQDRAASAGSGELRLQVVTSQLATHRAVPAVIWLDPLAGTAAVPIVPRDHYTLLQKNRMFSPHLQVIPVGSVVAFPNEDPFFHNVFSLFDGKRFDLGLYEAGSSKSVTFSRAGVSYIFCNIHPEMSAVIIAISTGLYTIADVHDAFVLRDIPPGDYKLHLWVEGVPASDLARLSKMVHISSSTLDLGRIRVSSASVGIERHTNKFGKPYERDPELPY